MKENLTYKLIKMFAGSDGAGGEGGEGDPTPNPTPNPQPNPKPTDEEAKLLKEVMEKKAKIKEQETRIGELEATVNQFNELGGINVLKELVEAKKQQQKKALEEKGEWEKLREQMVSEHAKSTEGLHTQIADLKKELAVEKNKINEMTIGASFANSQFLKDKTVLPPSKARAIFGSYFDIAEDGTVVAYDKPRGTNGRTALVDQMGKGVCFDVAMERIINADPDSESLLRAQEKNGAGSGSGGGKVTTPTAKKESAIDLIAKGLVGAKLV